MLNPTIVRLIDGKSGFLSQSASMLHQYGFELCMRCLCVLRFRKTWQFLLPFRKKKSIKMHQNDCKPKISRS